MKRIYIHKEGLQINITLKALSYKELQKLIKQWAVARDVFEDLKRLFDDPRKCGKTWWQRSYHQQRGFYRSQLSRILNQPMI